MADGILYSCSGQVHVCRLVYIRRQIRLIAILTVSIKIYGLVCDDSPESITGFTGILKLYFRRKVGNLAAFVADKMGMRFQMPVEPVSMVITGDFADIAERSQKRQVAVYCSQTDMGE